MQLDVLYEVIVPEHMDTKLKIGRPDIMKTLDSFLVIAMSQQFLQLWSL